MKAHRVAALAATLMLGGCMIAEPPVPSQARVAPPVDWRSPVADRTPVSPRWWQVYGDPVMTTLIERALA
ncbi:MAG: RND transporter, partial [Sphingobium sp.]